MHSHITLRHPMTVGVVELVPIISAAGDRQVLARCTVCTWQAVNVARVLGEEAAAAHAATHPAAAAEVTT